MLIAAAVHMNMIRRPKRYHQCYSVAIPCKLDVGTITHLHEIPRHETRDEEPDLEVPRHERGEVGVEPDRILEDGLDVEGDDGGSAEWLGKLEETASEQTPSTAHTVVPSFQEIPHASTGTVLDVEGRLDLGHRRLDFWVVLGRICSEWGVKEPGIVAPHLPVPPKRRVRRLPSLWSGATEAIRAQSES